MRGNVKVFMLIAPTEVALVLSALGLVSFTLAHPMVVCGLPSFFNYISNNAFYRQAKETHDLLPIGDLRALLGQGEKILDALSEDQKGQNVDNVGVNRKARDFLPSGSNSNTNTFKPSPSKALKDTFKPVPRIKFEKIVIDSNILIKPKQRSQTEPSSGLARPPPSSPPPTSAPPSTTSSPSTGSSELLATADPQLVGALGHASPEILAALQVIFDSSTRHKGGNGQRQRHCSDKGWGGFEILIAGSCT